MAVCARLWHVVTTCRQRTEAHIAHQLTSVTENTLIQSWVWVAEPEWYTAVCKCAMRSMSAVPHTCVPAAHPALTHH